MISTLSRRLAWTLVATRSSLIQQSSTAVTVTDATSTTTLSSREGVKRGSESSRVRRTTSGGRWGGAVALATSWGETETMLLEQMQHIFWREKGAVQVFRISYNITITYICSVPSHTYIHTHVENPAFRRLGSHTLRTPIMTGHKLNCGCHGTLVQIFETFRLTQTHNL